jgi:hypothetical protein
MRFKQDFLRLIQIRLEKEARELDSSQVTVRIEGSAIIISSCRIVAGDLRAWKASYPTEIELEREGAQQ